MPIFYFAANTNCPHCNFPLSTDMKLTSYCGNSKIQTVLNSCNVKCGLQYSESLGNDSNHPGLNNRVLDYWAYARLKERNYLVATNYINMQTTISYRENKINVIAFTANEILKFDLLNEESFKNKVKTLLVFT